MAKIDDLLQELCPDGVEWKELVDVVKTISPPIKLKVDSYLLSGLFPIIDQSKDQIAGYTDDISNTLPDGQYILYGDHTLAVKYYEGRFAQGADGLKILLSKSNLPKYIYYCICAYNIQNNEYKRHWTQAKQIKLPLPPLPIQHYIVEALDTFTDAISNLEQELALREKQLEYYREQLFAFDDETSLARKLFPDDREYLTLGKICEVYDGTHQTPKYTTEGIPFISVENIQDIYGSQKCISINDYNTYKVKPKVGDMFMTRIGSIGSCAVVDRQVELAYYVSLALLRPNPSLVNVRYLKHFLESNIGVTEIRKHSLLHAVPLKINKNDICKIMIALCSLSTQQQIVEILDTFEAMITNIKEEIALRTKQYEYYREKLLSFGK